MRKVLRKIKRKLRKYLGLLWLGTGITAVTGIVLGFLVNPIAFLIANILIACYFGIRLLISETRVERLFCLAWFILAILLTIF